MSFLAPIGAALSSFGGTAATLIGGVVSGAGTLMAAQAQSQQAAFQAQLAQQNATIARENAARVRDAGQIEQQQADLETTQLLGEQLAVQAASGVNLGSRSSLGVRRASRMIGRRDALNVRNAAELSAYNYEVDASNFDATAAMQKAAGRNALRAGALGALSSVIGTASNLSSSTRKSYTSSAPVPRNRPLI